MGTTHIHQEPPHQHAHEAPDQPLVVRAVRRIRQVMCGLRGHEMLVHFEERRISLACVSCGYESPGWSVSPSAVRATAGAGVSHYASPPNAGAPANNARRVA